MSYRNLLRHLRTLGIAVVLMSPLLIKLALAEGSSPFDGPAAHAAAPRDSRQMLALIVPHPAWEYGAMEGAPSYGGPAVHAAAPLTQNRFVPFGWAGLLHRGNTLEGSGATGDGGQHG
ncbi:hypothetical protein [Roseomonas populi]|uniref:Uncharacterized protein n=1 Tax=Roseomonas populi TaxID=3121582 RepID=A0ABT1XB12_9PROT|nr:hypothetical protein [Roseomonas pecuniae]MCR0985305.1 hypothetical protein [Roseomonas pecuniae]